MARAKLTFTRTIKAKNQRKHNTLKFAQLRFSW